MTDKYNLRKFFLPTTLGPLLGQLPLSGMVNEIEVENLPLQISVDNILRNFAQDNVNGCHDFPVTFWTAPVHLEDETDKFFSMTFSKLIDLSVVGPMVCDAIQKELDRCSLKVDECVILIETTDVSNIAGLNPDENGFIDIGNFDFKP